MQYNTKRKKAVAGFFKVYPETFFTAEQVAVALDDIGRSTVYRIITELCENGYLIREYSEKNACWMFKADKESCHEHFHIKCMSCGRFVHLDNKETEQTLLCAAENMGFSIDVRKTVLYGLCKQCKEKSENQ